MYFITTKRMLEVCFSAHPNIQYRTLKFLYTETSLVITKFHQRKPHFFIQIFIQKIPFYCLPKGMKKYINSYNFLAPIL